MGENSSNGNVVKAEGRFGLTKYNNIGTFEPKCLSGNCLVKWYLTDGTTLI